MVSYLYSRNDRLCVWFMERVRTRNKAQSNMTQQNQVAETRMQDSETRKSRSKLQHVRKPSAAGIREHQGRVRWCEQCIALNVLLAQIARPGRANAYKSGSLAHRGPRGMSLASHEARTDQLFSGPRGRIYSGGGSSWGRLPTLLCHTSRHGSCCDTAGLCAYHIAAAADAGLGGVLQEVLRHLHIALTQLMTENTWTIQTRRLGVSNNSLNIYTGGTAAPAPRPYTAHDRQDVDHIYKKLVHD